MVIIEEWIIFSTQNEVVFLHLRDPLNKFITASIKVNEIYPFSNDKIALFEYKYIHFYQLNDKNLP